MYAAQTPNVVMERPRPVPQRPRDARGRFVSSRALATLLEHRAPPAQAQATSVLFVVSEMADYIKAGGLGDVAAALPRALRQCCDVRVLIPGYPEVLARIDNMAVVGEVAPQARMPACRIGLTHLPDGLPVYVLLCPDLFERAGSPYVNGAGAEWEDNALRFATFAYAVSRIASGSCGLGWLPALLHLNDWPSALAAAYVRWNCGRTPSVLTIHNLAYQGLFPLSMTDALGVPAGREAELDFHGCMSFLKAGIVHASRINTVSVSYAAQITGPEEGCGMHELLAARAASGHLTGIVNGIDPSWDPASDQYLAAHFSVNRCDGKQENARQVRAAFGLPDTGGPLFAVVSRLVHQKGLDITCEVAPQIAAAGGQIVVIGHGEHKVEAQVAALVRRYPGAIGAYIGFEEALARRMFAGADFLLMPSRFEPCGLSQMYAQRFGCLPIAHATGGLIDTVDDGVTGFLFKGATAEGLRRCVQRALRTFRNRSLLEAMRRAAMLRPAGWDAAGRQYLELYHEAVEGAA
jgi:starch synthase